MVTLNPEHNTIALTHLRYRWLLTLMIWGGILFFGHQSLQAVWPHASRWALVTGTMLSYHLWFLWRGLSDNHREGESRLLPIFGVGNTLTLARGLGVALVAGFIGSPWPLGKLAWLPALLYMALSIADIFDGYLARLKNQDTVLGGKLDMEFDGLGILVAAALAVWYGQLPWWYLAIGGLRYFYLFALWWRQRQGLPIYELPPSIYRRPLAGFQMTFLMVALWPILPADGLTLNGIVYGIPITLGFLRDWLVVSGRLDPTSSLYLKTQQTGSIIITKWLPLLLRLALMITMLMIYSQITVALQPPAWVELIISWRLAFPHLLAIFISVIAIITTFTTVLGIAVRISSFILLTPITFEILSHGLQWTNGIALTSILSLMLLGTGYFSLWEPKEKLFMGRAGA